MDYPKISIIIPVYNCEKYIEKCVLSAINQTYPNLEIIIVDDGSTDDSGGIVDRFASDDSRITVIHTENGGASVARNTALNVFTGDWIIFLDSDDWLVETACETLVEAIDERTDYIFFAFNVHNGNNVRIAKPFILSDGNVEDNRTYIYAKAISQFYDKKRVNTYLSAGCAGAKMIRGSIVRDNGIRFPKGIVIGEDTIFMLDVLEKSGGIVFVDKPLLNYRISENQATNNERYIPACVASYDSLLSMYEAFLERHTEEELRKAYWCRCIQALNRDMLCYFFNPGNKLCFTKRIADFKQLCVRYPFCDAIRFVDERNVTKQCRTMVLLLRKHQYVGVYIWLKLRSIKHKIRKQVR